MEMKCHEVLEQKMCKELELFEAKYSQNPSKEMPVEDLDKIDKLYHALKSMATYTAMKEAEGYEESWHNGGNSGKTGYSYTAPYMNRSGNSYADGYSMGYSEAMNQMNRPIRRW